MNKQNSPINKIIESYKGNKIENIDKIVSQFKKKIH